MKQFRDKIVRLFVESNGIGFHNPRLGKPRSVLLALPMLALMPINLAIAEEVMELEEVVVTATRRSENLLDVAQSIGVLSDEFLKDGGFDSLSQFAGQVAGLNFTERGPGQTSINIRGIAADPGTQSVSTVGIYIDDVALTNDNQDAQADIRTFDLERIEVLRGPQGTLYGEGAVGGVVRYITKKANSKELQGELEASFSNTDGGDNTVSVNGMLNIPLVEDVLALRVVVYNRDIGGYIDNPTLAKDDFNSADISGGRASLVWELSENFSAEMMAVFSRIDVDGDNITRGGAKDEFVASALNPRQDDYDLYSLTLNYVNDNFSVTSVSGYSDRTSSRTTVESQAALLGFVQPISAFFSDVVPSQSIFQFDEQNKNFTQEIRIVSQGEGAFQWAGGLWYRDGDFENISNRIINPNLTYGGNGDLSSFGVPFVLGPNPLGGPAGQAIAGSFSRDPSTSSFENKAIFGEVSYDITDEWEVLVGGRWFEETRGTQSPLGTGGFNEAQQLLNTLSGLPNTGTDDSFDISVFTPKATVTYRPGDNTLAYFSYGEGVRSGGRNGSATVVLNNSCRAFYDEDVTVNHELGFKIASADGRMTLESAAYYIDWKDLQVLFFDASTFNSCVENAGSAHSTGLELSFKALITDSLSLNLSGTWIEAELDEDLQGADATSAVIEKGTQLPNVPKHKIGASLQYDMRVFDHWNASINLNVSNVGSSKAAIEPGVRGDLEQPSYTISNLSVSFQQDRYGVKLFVNNLSNEYAVFADDTFGGIHRNQPRTIGLSLSANF